jgi:hypothetical protein
MPFKVKAWCSPENLVGLTSMCFQEKALGLLGTRNFRCSAIFVRRQVYLVHVLNEAFRSLLATYGSVD